MAGGGHGQNLAPEALHLTGDLLLIAFVGVDQLLGNHLDRHLPLQFGLAGAVNFSLTTGGDVFQYFPAAVEHLTGLEHVFLMVAGGGHGT